MSDQESVYIGNGKILMTKFGGIGVKIKLSKKDLWNFLKNKDQTEAVTSSFTTRDGEKLEELNLALWPLKDPTNFKTHSLKIDFDWDWKKRQDNNDHSDTSFESISENDEKIPF